jgi:preprotein translocase subunit SecD
LNDRRRHLILIGCILAALIGVAFLAVPSSPVHKKLTLGLDLQGGLEVVLKAEPPKGHKLTPEDLSRSIDIMRNRIDKLGVSEPEIRKQGSNQIVIQLAGIHNVNDAAALIGKTAVLEFYDFEADVTGPSVSGGLLNATPVASGSMYDLLAAPATRLLANKGEPAQWYLFNDKHVVKAGPAPTRAKLLANEIVRKPTASGGLGNHVPKDWKILTIPNDTVAVSCVATNCPTQVPGNGQKGFYLLKHHDVKDFPNNPIPEMTGNQLKLSGTRADIDTQTNQPVVLMQFTGAGKKAFHEITRREAQRGALGGDCNQGKPPPNVQHFAIVLDRQIQSTPYIDYCVNPDGIPGDNGAQIDMGGSGLRTRKARSCFRPVLCRRVQDRGHRRFGDARQGLADPGEESGDRRPPRRRALPAPSLSLPRPRRGDRARHLRGVPVRRDPALQRHDDPAGLRGTDPYDWGGRRRERRCVRTHQGRGARR